jgi:hypothetical protein
MIRIMQRRISQLATVLIVLLATLTPLANCFDTWDKNPNPAKDTEMRLAAWFAGAGFVLAMARLVRLVAPAARNGRLASSVRRVAARPLQLDVSSPVPTGSPPPLALRI